MQEDLHALAGIAVVGTVPAGTAVDKVIATITTESLEVIVDSAEHRVVELRPCDGFDARKGQGAECHGAAEQIAEIGATGHQVDLQAQAIGRSGDGSIVNAGLTITQHRIAAAPAQQQGIKTHPAQLIGDVAKLVASRQAQVEQVVVGGVANDADIGQGVLPCSLAASSLVSDRRRRANEYQIDRGLRPVVAHIQSVRPGLLHAISRGIDGVTAATKPQIEAGPVDCVSVAAAGSSGNYVAGAAAVDFLDAAVTVDACFAGDDHGAGSKVDRDAAATRIFQYVVVTRDACPRQAALLATVDHIATSAAFEAIIAQTTQQGIVAVTAAQRVVATPARQPVVGAAAGQRVVAEIGTSCAFDVQQRIGAAIAIAGGSQAEIDPDRTGRAAKADDIKTATAIDRVVASTAAEELRQGVAISSLQDVVEA